MYVFYNYIVYCILQISCSFKYLASFQDLDICYVMYIYHLGSFKNNMNIFKNVNAVVIVKIFVQPIRFSQILEPLIKNKSSYGLL